MADKTNKTRITIPNGTTGQEFQVQGKYLNINLSIQTTDRLVTNAGKKDEKALTIAESNNTAINITVPIETPEQLEKAIADNPIIAQLLPLLTEAIVKKYS